MINLTVRQLLDVGSRYGDKMSAMAEFLALQKPVAVAWKNRGMLRSLERALKDYQAADKTDMLALLAQEIEIEGDPVRIDDMRGDLSEQALSLLMGTFIVAP
jgi:hypothetical protein